MIFLFLSTLAAYVLTLNVFEIDFSKEDLIRMCYAHLWKDIVDKIVIESRVG